MTRTSCSNQAQKGNFILFTWKLSKSNWEIAIETAIKRECMRQLWPTILKTFPWWRKPTFWSSKNFVQHERDFVLHSVACYTFWGLNILLFVYRGKQTKSMMRFWLTGKMSADFINPKILLLTHSKHMLCECREHPRAAWWSALRCWISPCRNTVLFLVFSPLDNFQVRCTLEVLFCRGSKESTVRELSRKIVFGSRKKNKLSKGC